MAIWKNEAEAREQIKAMVAQYYHDFKEKKEPFKPGDRITYASRVFDEKEMCALTDATLDFWLTTGRFSDVNDALQKYGFYQIHQGYIVNLSKIKSIQGYSVMLEDNTSVLVSVRKKTSFLIAYAKYLEDLV